jgi:hypothetical protein
MIAIPYTFVIALRQETATSPLMRRQPSGTPTITHAGMKKVVWRTPHIAVKGHLKRHSTPSFSPSVATALAPKPAADGSMTAAMRCLSMVLMDGPRSATRYDFHSLRASSLPARYTWMIAS